jgi:hypothetical protein
LLFLDFVGAQPGRTGLAPKATASTAGGYKTR